MATDPQTTKPRWYRRIWWIDLRCDVFGHPWEQRGENSAAMECPRCRRNKLLMLDRVTGKTEWIITL